MAADQLRARAGEPARPRQHLWHTSRLRVHATLFVLALVTGFALALQVRTQEAAGRQGQRSSSVGQAVLVDDLLRTNAALRRELLALQQARSRGGPGAGSSDQAQALLQELAVLRAVNGRVELLGPGVEVEIAAAVAPEDLHDLFNDLRAAGAEALALNEHRVIAAAVSGEPDALRLNGAALTRPYIVRAIGPVAALERALTRPGGMVALLRQNYPGVRINVVRRDRIRIPAATAGAPRFTYARPVE